MYERQKWCRRLNGFQKIARRRTEQLPHAVIRCALRRVARLIGGTDGMHLMMVYNQMTRMQRFVRKGAIL